MALINASETSFNASIPNSPTFTVRRETVVTAGTPVQVAALAVPANRGITVQNAPTNGNNDILYIANSSPNALLASSRIQLSRSQSAVLYVDDLSKIWINSNNNNTAALLIVEA